MPFAFRLAAANPKFPFDMLTAILTLCGLFFKVLIKKYINYVYFACK